jgi:maltooligosyltrehalose trehalohydrolase
VTAPPRTAGVLEAPRGGARAADASPARARPQPGPPRAPWTLERGARVLPDGSVRFETWAPNARAAAVRVVEDPRAGGAPGEADHPLEPLGGGVFGGVVPAARAGADYRFVLDGRPLPDPVSRHQPAGVHGPSRVVDPLAFGWSDAGWRGREAADLVICEIHVGTFTPEGTFDAAAAALPRLAELGITAVELMPVAQFPGARNWGYDGVFPYAAQDTYGGPGALRRLVDAAHAAGLAVLLDVVYNHLGPEGNVLEAYGPYFTDRYRTPWGRAVNYDDAGSDEVRRYVLDNARHWIVEHHVDGLRLDAVHAIFDFGARHVLAELADELHALGGALGRRVLVIAESDLNDPRLVRPPERGGHGLDAQWSDDFHHAVHAALTGERTGYYEDFGGVEPVARALAERFVYAGRRSAHRRRRHGAPAGDVPADRFVVAVQNHDQVGNRARGERLSCLVDPDRQRLAAALLLLSPYVPLLFQGEEYGETNPFLYFTSHGDPALVQAVREGRRREFASFAWRGDVPDPQSEETFARSRIDPSRAERPPHAGLLALHRELLRRRREEPALRPGAAAVAVLHDARARWAALRLGHAAGDLLAVFNLGEGEVLARAPGAPCAWGLVLSTDDAAWGGPGVRSADAVGAAEAARLPVPPLTGALYRTGRAADPAPRRERNAGARERP